MEQNIIAKKEIPYIDRSYSGISLIPFESIDYENRILWLTGEINNESALVFTKQLLNLIKEDAETPVKIFINSPGGSIDAGLIIFDLIDKAKPNTKIETYCIGSAYSMAAVIFAAGSKRYMLPNSKLMLHEPLIQTVPGGNATDIKTLSDSLQNNRLKLNCILSALTGHSAETIEEACKYDHYFDAREAINFNLSDIVLTDITQLY